MYTTIISEKNMTESFPPMEGIIAGFQWLGQLAFTSGKTARRIHENFKDLGVYTDARRVTAEGIRKLADIIYQEEKPEIIPQEEKPEIIPQEEKEVIPERIPLKITRRLLLSFAKEKKIPNYSRMGTYDLKVIYDNFTELERLS